MFDLRYHVASLAAVFLALIIGILVGVGISDRGLVDSAKTKFLQDEVASLQRRLDNKSTQTADQTRDAGGGTDVHRRRPTRRWPDNRLKGKQVAVVFVGSVDGGIRSSVEPGAHRRRRAAGASAGAEGADRPQAARRGAQGPAGRSRVARQGQPGQPRPGARPGARARRRDAALGLAHRRARRGAGGRQQETRRRRRRRPHGRRRSAVRTSKFLLGLYEGLGSAGVPAVGAEQTDAADSATAVFRQAGLSTVDDVDTPVGRLALAATARRSAARPVRGEGLGRPTAPCRRCRPGPPRRVAEPLAVLIAARDEEARIGQTVEALRRGVPRGARSSSQTTARATRRPRPHGERAARVVRLPRLGKGQALTLAEREAPPGPLLLCDADLEGDLAPLLDGADLAIAAFAERQGGGFGIAKRAARALVRTLSGFEAREPLSGQRALSPARTRGRASRSAPGFGCEVRMTIDAIRAGLRVRGARAAASPPGDRSRHGRLRPPRQAAARGGARLWADRDQPPRPAAAARRGARRPRRRQGADAGACRRRRDRAARPRRRPLERPRAWLPRPPRQGLDHRHGQGGRDPAGRARDDALAAQGDYWSRSPRTC